MTRTPDFMIAGAAKAGTTVLWRWLSAHPDVFMPALKEPSFFAVDNGRARPDAGPFDQVYTDSIVTDWNAYLALFSNAGTKLAGEASPIYLQHPDAARRIALCLPDVKIILILRNPVERAFSQFAHHVRDGLETTSDFEAALDAAPRRRKSGWSRFHDYVEGGLYAAQIERFQNQFRPDRLLVITHDLIEAEPEDAWARICGFLEIDAANQPDFRTRDNVSSRLDMMPRWQTLHRLLSRPGSIAARIGAVAPETLRRKLKEQLVRFNRAPAPRLSAAAVRQLADIYRPEIGKIEDRLRLDLTGWTKRWDELGRQN